jgi:hypothetical protein
MPFPLLKLLMRFLDISAWRQDRRAPSLRQLQLTLESASELTKKAATATPAPIATTLAILTILAKLRRFNVEWQKTGK